MLLTRREFLKLSSLTAAAALLPPLPPDDAPPRPALLGRAIYGVYVYDRPSFGGRQMRLLPAETVFSIYDTVTSDDKHYNRTWYRLAAGFVYSGTVQPVRWLTQKPTLDVPARGFLAEVSIPFTTARHQPRADSGSVYRLYYSTTHWVKQAQAGSDGRIWYKLHDDRLERYYWVEGAHLRLVAPAELTPISPGKDKRIEIDLERQVMRCYEAGTLALETLCSTGPYLRTENGRRVFGTPAGDWKITRKRPSRHMAGDDGASADFFDLPGVPWVSYFHWWGVSFHGTYWHNDYGKPRSHGCINLTPEDARWVFRWTLPHVPPGKAVLDGAGTQVIVY